MTSEKAAARFCRRCGSRINPNAAFCRQCGQPVSRPAASGPRAESHPPTGIDSRSSAERASQAEAQRQLPRWALLGVGCAVMLLCVAGTLVTIALWPDGRSVGESTAWDNAESELLQTETVAPSDDYQVVEVGDTMSIVISGGLLDSPQELSASAVSGGPELRLPLPSEPLGVFEISLGETTFFSEPLIIELPYDPDAVKSPLAPEYALVASYWDEALEDWIEMPSAVDTERQRLVIPTLHLTKVRYDYVVADGHIYNDYFSIKYDPDELEAMKKKHPNFEDTLTDYVDDVAAALEEARQVYDEEGFRQLQQIKAVYDKIDEVPDVGGFGGRYVEKHITNYNVYITGDRHDESWSWKGIAYSSLSRSKFTGNIYIPYDHSGVQALEIAHEVFHSIQNRYYTMVGMTEFGLPGSTSPGYQLLNRLWWFEATAEYAAGKLVHPRPDGRPNAHMGGDIDYKRLEKALTHSPSALRKRSDRAAYTNAWFIEFLVSEKGIDFTEMFETVASYWWPSVYDNLVSYLETKGLDINQVYAEYAVWWLFSPSSPLSRTDPGKVPEGALTDQKVKALAADLTDWPFEGGSGPHRARVWEISVNDAARSATDSARPRALIVSLEQERTQSLRVEPPLRMLWVIKWASGTGSALTAHPLTPEHPVLVETLQPGEALYLLAVRNDDEAGVLGDWYPEVRVTEAQLKIEPAQVVGISPDELHTVTAVATGIPEALTPRLHFDCMLGGRQHLIRADALENVDRSVSAALENVQLASGEQPAAVRLYADGDVLLAEETIRASAPDEPAPEPALRWVLQETTQHGDGPFVEASGGALEAGVDHCSLSWTGTTWELDASGNRVQKPYRATTSGSWHAPAAMVPGQTATIDFSVSQASDGPEFVAGVFAKFPDWEGSFASPTPPPGLVPGVVLGEANAKATTGSSGSETVTLHVPEWINTPGASATISFSLNQKPSPNGDWLPISGCTFTYELVSVDQD